MKMFQRTGRNSVSIQAGRNSIAVGGNMSGNVVVSGSGNRVAAAGAHDNVFGDNVVVGNGEIRISGRKRSGAMQISSGGSTFSSNGDISVATSKGKVEIDSESDVVVYLNGKRLN